MESYNTEVGAERDAATAREPRQGILAGLVRAVRTVPTWLLVLAIAAMGAGAATGTVLSSEVQGEISISVSQALIVGKPQISLLPASQATFVSVSDDGTQFSSAAEVFAGNTYKITLPITNNSNNDIVAELILVAPITGVGASESITFDTNGLGVITDAVQIAPTVWKFTVKSSANGATGDGVLLDVSVGNLVEPGFYTFTGTIKAVPF